MIGPPARRPRGPREALLQAAIELAAEGARAGHGGPFGALVARDGAIVARGENRVTSTGDPTAHAEVVAIREACRALGTFSLEGAELYASCEPCPMCLAAAWWARVDRVWYAATREDAARAGFDDDLLWTELALPPAARRLPVARLAAPRAEEPFEVWRNKTDRIPY